MVNLIVGSLIYLVCAYLFSRVDLFSGMFQRISKIGMRQWQMRGVYLSLITCNLRIEAYVNDSQTSSVVLLLLPIHILKCADCILQRGKLEYLFIVRFHSLLCRNR